MDDIEVSELARSPLRWWGMVHRAEGYIRDMKYGPKALVESLLTEGWSDELKAQFEIQPIRVQIDK